MVSMLLNFLLLLLPLVFSAPAPVPHKLGDILDQEGGTIVQQAGTIVQQAGTIVQEAGTIVQEVGKAISQLANSTTQNALLTNQTCNAMTVIFARGTEEPGNVGILAGPPFFDALDTMITTGNVAVQGVDYPANVAGFLAGGSDSGALTMASLVNQSLTQCPNSKIVMCGYSQGGQLVHKAATNLGAQMSKVNSVVIFGDPNNGTAVVNIDASKVLVVCHANDNICQQGDRIKEAHLTYSENATEAATFVAGQSGLGMDSTKTMVTSNMMGITVKIN